jgi:hypothetical protein
MILVYHETRGTTLRQQLTPAQPISGIKRTQRHLLLQHIPQAGYSAILDRHRQVRIGQRNPMLWLGD